MRLLMTIGYDQHFLLPEGADAGAIVNAFSSALPVKEEGPWDARVWTPQDKQDVTFKLVSNTSSALPGNRTEEVSKIVELAKANNELTAEVARLKKAVVGEK